MAKIIQVKNLFKSFGKVKAVNNVSFDVDEGQFFAFLGPNGAGKTTTMRIMATLDNPTSGQVIINGFDVQKNPDGVRRSIGFAMQAVGLDDLASAKENLLLMGRLYGLNKTEAETRMNELLKLFNLEKVADRYVSKYSGGMRRRLDVAVALMHKPKILFLDEPTEGLDPVGRRLIWDYLQKLNKEGVTIFLTTHYMEEADFLARDLAIINKGKIVVRGTPEELKKKLKKSFISLKLAKKDQKKGFDKICRLLSKNNCRELTSGIEIESASGEKDLPKIIGELEKNGIKVDSFNLRSPSLEDVFIKYAGESFVDETAGGGVDPYMRMRGQG